MVRICIGLDFRPLAGGETEVYPAGPGRKRLEDDRAGLVVGTGDAACGAGKRDVSKQSTAAEGA